MRKIYRLLMIMAMLPFMAMSVHAEDIVLRFTASTQYADYHEFSIVKVENLTRNWQHELIYPDTVLVLHTPHGIEEMEGIGNALALAGPNPFKGSTFADLMLSEGGNVELKALQIDGKLVARYEGSLPKGTHRITFHANSPQVYLLVANTPQGCLVTKLMNIGYGMDNSIDVNMLSESVDRDFSKSRFIGTFMLGDNMRYTAYDNGVASNAITQHQSHSEDITLQFMVQGTVLPKVRTDNFTNIGATTVTANGEVYSDGGETVTERGFCWSTQPNPTINDNRVVCGSGLGVFSADITDLIPNTTYYFRAYAINAVGTAYGLEKVLVTFVALPKVITNNVTDIESTSATANGEVISDGGSEVTERGFCWATHDNPTIDDNFIVCGSGLGTFSDIMTNLEPNTVYYVRAYAINSVDIMYGNQKSFETLLPLAEVITTEVTDIGSTTATGNGEVVSDGGVAVTERGVCWSTSHNPTIGDTHTASGAGLGTFDAAITDLTPHTIYYVRAYATNSVGTSYGEEKQFVTLFDAPDGTTGGLFSVTADKQVYMSNGNLQYQASTGVWRFAEHQWEYLGNDNNNISSTYSGWIDLFGWGTGNNPTNSSEEEEDYASFIDWGVNPISNGGNSADMWRTLKNSEWEYLLHTRNTSTGIRYAKAMVNGVPGVIVIPDEWDTDYYTLNSTNVSTVDFTVNTITAAEWESGLNAHGAMFLPAAGDRTGTTVEAAGEIGLYWSSSSGGNMYAYNMAFDGIAVTTGYYYRHCGRSVRLVVPVMEVLTLDATDVDASSATLNGKIYCKDLDAVTSLGFVYGTDANNLDNNVNVTANAHTFSAAISNLEPGTTYYYKAFASTANGTFYGELRLFETQLGALEGSTGSLFSVADNTQVFFSKGNLQYQASTNIWRFAENQWDYVGTQTYGVWGDNGGNVSGSDNVNISLSYTGWIDLFGWGTGNNPTNSSSSNGDYGIFTDWGTKSISNGGNIANYWRTLTEQEWHYLMNTRTTLSGIRYAKATVNDVTGVIILPDDWSSSYYTLSSTNTLEASYTTNSITLANWTNYLESHGAVFLPAAGFRSGITIGDVVENGYYWSSSPNGSNFIYCLFFGSNYLSVGYFSPYFGFSVRLVAVSE